MTSGSDSGAAKAATPIVVELAAGTYFWCACGESSHQPFCDGSHRSLGEAKEQVEPGLAAEPKREDGEPLQPLRWRLDKDQKVALCTCKRTATPPLCDGAHSRG